MTRDNDTYAAAAHSQQKSPHDWDKPPPGAGPMRVCRKCGAKETKGKRHEACDGLQNEAFQPTAHDYDPI